VGALLVSQNNNLTKFVRNTWHYHVIIWD